MKSNIMDGIQIVHVQAKVLEQAEILIKLGDLDGRDWNLFISASKPPLTSNRSAKDRDDWKANAAPVRMDILGIIDALRTPA